MSELATIESERFPITVDFYHHHTLTLDPFSKITLPSRDQTDFKLHAGQVNLRINSEEDSHRSAWKVITPDSTISVTGTIFSVSWEENNTLVKVQEGSVNCRSHDQQINVYLQAGQQWFSDSQVGVVSSESLSSFKVKDKSVLILRGKGVRSGNAEEDLISLLRDQGWKTHAVCDIFSFTEEPSSIRYRTDSRIGRFKNLSQLGKRLKNRRTVCCEPALWDDMRLARSESFEKHKSSQQVRFIGDQSFFGPRLSRFYLEGSSPVSLPAGLGTVSPASGAFVLETIHGDSASASALAIDDPVRMIGIAMHSDWSGKHAAVKNRLNMIAAACFWVVSETDTEIDPWALSFILG